MKTNKIKNESESIVRTKGITLIVLVVTIIVLLILAGIAMSLIVGNNGLFSRAKKAVTINKSTTIVEKLELAIRRISNSKDIFR